MGACIHWFMGALIMTSFIVVGERAWVHELHELTGSNRCTSLDARLMM